MVENKTPAPEPAQEPVQEPAQIPEAQGPKFDMSEAPDLSSETATTAKIQVNELIAKAKDTIVGSGHVKEEIVRLGNGYVDLPKDAVTEGLRAVKDLVTLHPIRATKDLANGIVQTAGNIMDITSAPTRFAVAGAYATGRGVKAVAKLPFQAAGAVLKSPFWAWDVLNRGLEKMNQTMIKMTK